MKELSIEEKVKRYDKAVEIINDYYQKIKFSSIRDFTQEKEILEKAFPELKESEDEKIRKALIYHYQGDGCISTNEYRIDYKEIRAWLEKQSIPQVRTDLEWVNAINDACDKRYSEEYAHGEYCHEQSFKWGFQEGVDWIEKQCQVKESVISQHENKTCKENSNSLTSEDIRKGLIQYFSTFSLDTFAGLDPKKILSWLEKQGNKKSIDELQEAMDIAVAKCFEEGEQKSEEIDNLHNYLYGEQKPVDKAEPKFKIGDTVTVKPMSCHGKTFKGEPFKIVDIIEDNYISDDGKTYSISLQNGWKLVEQEPSNNVEPKFHEGDWVVYKDAVWKVCNISLQNYYELLKINNEVSTRLIEDVDENAHLWIIQDAKDGDVLSDGTTIFIFKDLLSDGSVMSYCDYDTDSGESDDFCPLSMNLMCSKITPATKEQHDTLKKAMTEAGYEWDAEKKELKRIIDEKQIKKNLQDNSFRRMFEQKPAWSEEDKEHIESILERLEGMCKKGATFTTTRFAVSQDIDWFKSLKDRVQPQPKQKWKQENTGDLTDFENAMMHIGDSFFGDNAGLDPNGTNAIKEQANLLLELILKKKWSEEEEENFKKAIKVLKVTNFHHIADMLQEMKYKLIPREETNNWKPSDEQMNALNDVISSRDIKYDVLSELWKDLDKLRGE